MKIILNETINIEVSKGLNVFLTNDSNIRDIFLSSFSIWFKTGMETKETSSIEVFDNSELLKKTSFDLLSIVPSIEDYLKPRSIKAQISNQLYDLVNFDNNISSSLVIVVEKFEKIVREINNIQNNDNFELSLSPTIEKDLIKLIQLDSVKSDYLNHSILDSKLMLIDLMITFSKKKEIIIFIPYACLGLTNIEIIEILNTLRELDAYVIVFEMDLAILDHLKEQDNTRVLINDYHEIVIQDMFKEIRALTNSPEADIFSNIKVIIDQYLSQSKLDFALIKEYIDNTFMI